MNDGPIGSLVIDSVLVCILISLLIVDSVYILVSIDWCVYRPIGPASMLRFIVTSCL